MLYFGFGTLYIDLIRAYLLLIEPGNSRNHWNKSLIRGFTSDFADPPFSWAHWAHTAYEAWLGRQGSRAAFSQIQTAPGTYDQDYFTIKVFSVGKSDHRRDVTQGNPLRPSEWGFKIGCFLNVYGDFCTFSCFLLDTKGPNFPMKHFLQMCYAYLLTTLDLCNF